MSTACRSWPPPPSSGVSLDPPHPRGATRHGAGEWDLGGAFRELREGWEFIAVNPIVRAVNIGLATG